MRPARLANLRRVSPAEAVPSVTSLDRVLASLELASGADRVRTMLSVGTVWELSATYDHLSAAVHRAPLKSRKDRRICALAAEGVSWDGIARRLGVGKHRVQRVVDAAMAWRDPEDDQYVRESR